jgi:2',3'-cyclic-nucleotide 2'-phosphodiesterase (5'-nucleotidase family)
MISSRLYKLLLVTMAFSYASCQSHYELVKANRVDYNINTGLAADSSIIKTYLPYKQKMDAQMSAVIGQSAKPLTKGVPESLLGNFFSDAVMYEAKKIAPGIDFSLSTTNGGLRNNLPAGNITMSAMFELMPFDNELVLLKLKGTDVEQLLNFVATTGGQPMSGITLKIKDKQPVNVLINGLPFDRNKTYLVLVSDYLANGGDNARGLAAPLERKNVGLLIRNALISYVKAQTAAGKIVNAELDGRIKVL